MITLSLPSDLETRLIAAAARAGRSQTAWVVQAIADQLEDEEDYQDAVTASQQTGPVHSSASVKHELGL